MSKCIAIASRSGLRCKQLAVEGELCPRHAAMVTEGKEVKFAVISEEKPAVRRKPKKKTKVAQPELGADHLVNLINATTVGSETTDGSTKLEFVDGQWTEVPVEEEERPVKDAREHFEQKDAVGPVQQTGELVDPSEIFTKHAHLVKYVSMDAVVNKHLFSAYVRNVAGMSYFQCGQEFKLLKSEEDALSAERKQVSEEAHHQYGRSIPEDVQVVLDILMADITDFKNKRAVIIAALEWHEEKDAKENNHWNGMDKSWEEGESSGFQAKVKHFFGGLWNKMKGVVPQTLIAVGVVLLSLAVAALFNMADSQAPAPKPVHHDTVVQHHSKPVVQHKPVVDVQPTDNVAARQHAAVKPHGGTGVAYVVKPGDTLWSIAKAHYGDSSQWSKIYDANKSKLMHDDVRNVTDGGHWIHAGQTIVVPGGE